MSGHRRSASGGSGVGTGIGGPPIRDSKPGHARSGSVGVGVARKDSDGGAGTPTKTPAKETHLLALKVMRLTKPRLVRTAQVPCDPADLGSEKLAATLSQDPNFLADLPAFGLGEVCTLPQSFGSIFLGEVFSCYLSLHNESEQECTDVMVTAELQTGNDRTPITPTGSDADKVTLKPGASYDTVQCSEVKEPGTHLLVCNVNYRNPDGDKKFFRKFFKFVVYKPLDIKTVTYNSGGEVFLEAQIKNITQHPMFFEKVDFHAAPVFASTDLNVIAPAGGSAVVAATGEGEADAGADGDDGGKGGGGGGKADARDATTFSSNRYLKPQDVRQHLYRLVPREPGLESKANAAAEVGKLEIVWRTNLGELGRLQTNMLPRAPMPAAPLEIEAVTMPAEVRATEQFSMLCKVSNTGKQPVDLFLREVPEKAGRVHYAGVANRALGALKPGETMALPLQFVPSSTGLLPIKGLALYDKVANRLYDILSLPHVFVTVN